MRSIYGLKQKRTTPSSLNIHKKTNKTHSSFLVVNTVGDLVILHTFLNK
jgi:hypothetical protein